MIKNANTHTNEIFKQYEHLIREIFVDSLEYIKDEDPKEWFDETQDAIHLAVETDILATRNVLDDSPEEQIVLEELMDIEYDLIVKHLLSTPITK